MFFDGFQYYFSVVSLVARVTYKFTFVRSFIRGYVHTSISLWDEPAGQAFQADIPLANIQAASIIGHGASLASKTPCATRKYDSACWLSLL